ncbi:MAG: acyl-ACP--UDP-N-acetylglucosamine O-acyltransferase [Phycisphaerae bacterium]|nr:acyl-ACP--UDP-N-acetylglucosamine O-acyltransferase [Phycisphaerae bacterium]
MSSQIHPTAFVAPSAQLGSNVVVGPFSFVDEGAQIGEGTVLDTHVVIGKDTCIGKNNRLFAGAVIGRPPQILGMGDETRIGRLVIGDGNTIREHVTIHPSMYPDEETRIGSNNLLMIGVHLGHDCILGDKIVISNYTQISGHCKIETGAWLSGMVAVHQFVTIGKWCYAAGYTGINHDVPPFVIVSGHYPVEVRAINKRGMARAGLSVEQQDKIYEAFKFIWRNDGPVLERVKELAARDGLDENVKAICEAMLRSSQQRFGRNLELQRH